MQKHNYEEYFTSPEDHIRKSSDLISLFFDKVTTEYDLTKPINNPDFSFDYSSFLEEKKLPDHTQQPKEALDDLLIYFKNCINWNNPGAMFNVTPPVNNLALAAASTAMYFNPNIAEDRSSGLFGLAELEVSKYLSELFGWDWKHSTGFSTYGGKATNTYAVKKALKDIVPEFLKTGNKPSTCFYVVSEKGHPCQKEVCGTLGVGEDNCLVIPSDLNGQIDLKTLESQIRDRLKKGHIFLGVTVNVGTTIEFIVDDIQAIVKMKEHLCSEFELNYKPNIHADAVIGWAWLFFKDYDFQKNPYEIPASTLTKISAMNKKVSFLDLVDSAGIDFHKTGFCPYSCSFYIAKNSEESTSKPMTYGKYSPYKETLELSRSGASVLAALASLKGLGKEGYIKLISNLVHSADYLRKKLSHHERIKILDEDCLGLTCMATLLPEVKSNQYNLTNQDVERIQHLNESFVSFLKENQHDELIGSLYLSSSRSYSAPGETQRWGALKLYPMSPFLTGQRLEYVADSLCKTVNLFFENYDINSIKVDQKRIKKNDPYHPIF